MCALTCHFVCRSLAFSLAFHGSRVAAAVGVPHRDERRHLNTQRPTKQGENEAFGLGSTF
jgi:hypothetical protein